MSVFSETFAAIADATFAGEMLRISVQIETQRLQHQQSLDQMAANQARFEELERQQMAMDPNVIDFGPDDVREVKHVPLMEMKE